jgi:hypothetical protein
MPILFKFHNLLNVSVCIFDLQDEESSSLIFGGTHLPVTAATSVLASEYQSNKPSPADANRYKLFFSA